MLQKVYKNIISDLYQTFMTNEILYIRYFSTDEFFFFIQMNKYCTIYSSNKFKQMFLYFQSQRYYSILSIKYKTYMHL